MDLELLKNRIELIITNFKILPPKPDQLFPFPYLIYAKFPFLPVLYESAIVSLPLSTPHLETKYGNHTRRHYNRRHQRYRP